jgi:hypothetical protein
MHSLRRFGSPSHLPFNRFVSKNSSNSQKYLFVSEKLEISFFSDFSLTKD